MNPAWQKLIYELISSGYLKTPRIIDAFKTIDRKDFVLPEYESEAYGNYPLPIGGGQTISQPLTVAFMLELFQPAPGQKILDIGHGSGWQAALLAEIVGEKGKVIAVERMPELCEFGNKNIAKYNFLKKGIVATFCQDATAGTPMKAPFDKIIAAAAAPPRAGRASPNEVGRAAIDNLPKAWREELKVGGIVVAPIGGSIWRFSKKSESEWKEEEFPGFSFVPLVSDGRPLRAGDEARASSAQSAGGPLVKDKPKQEAEPKTGLATEPKKFPRKLLADKKEKLKNSLWLPTTLLFISGLGSYLAYEIFAPLEFDDKKIEINIAEGAGVREIGTLLKNNGLIRSKWLFIGWTALSGEAARLKAGAYQFEVAASIPEVAKRLSAGEQFPNERIITIPEGWNLNDIAEYFELQGIASAEETFAIIGRPHKLTRETGAEKRLAAAFPFLRERPAGASFEGYLFPDTYRIFRGAPPEDIVEKMLENFQKKVAPELLAEIDRQKKTLFQIITMASLVEKEVPHEEDRPVIAGILWKRFGLGMGLQVDATISYLTGKKSTRITGEELAIDSPYNTYKYRGLPLGPIANPGISAIRAAIFPRSSPYLYYLSTPEGKTIFSRTLEEHNAAKAKYLK